MLLLCFIHLHIVIVLFFFYFFIELPYSFHMILFKSVIANPKSSLYNDMMRRFLIIDSSEGVCMCENSRACF